MLNISFELTATTFDDDNLLASGWGDVRLSPTGMDQAKKLGERHSGQYMPDGIFHSDLKSAEQTAAIAFSVKANVMYTDWRLREVNYGDMTSNPLSQVNGQKADFVTQPYPNGESYNQLLVRLSGFLNEANTNWGGKVILIIGGPDIKCGLDYLLNRTPIEQTVAEPVVWQPGWTYELA